MIDASLYHYIYILVVMVISCLEFPKYRNYSITRVNIAYAESIYSSFFLCLFMTIFIGLRPISSVFIDMGGYAGLWSYWSQGTYHFTWDVQNILFDNLRMYMSTAEMPVELFFFLISCIYFVTTYLACRKLFPKDTLFAYLVFLAAFSTFSFGTNGIKAGAAASIFLLALAYYDNLKITIPLALISWGFHHSMVMVVASYIIVLFYNKPKWYFALWGISVLIAALHISTFQEFFASMADEQGQSYLEGQEFGKGFRLDFILYSAMPVLVGYYAIFKKKIQSKAYNIVLCLYLITNSIWMLCMYAEFTNRIAYLSWFQYPIVLIYPFLKENWGINQYKILRKVAYAHLAFTLFMTFVFYAK